MSQQRSATVTALTIAGSDPSGGAGIQADMKAMSALGAYAMSVITALTAQSTRGVAGVHAVPVDFVRLQMDTLLEDIVPDATKIGMLATAELADAVVRAADRRGLTVLVEVTEAHVARELQVLGSHGMAAVDYPDMLALIERGALEPQLLIERTISLREAAKVLPEFDRVTVAGMTMVDPALLT